MTDENRTEDAAETDAALVEGDVIADVDSTDEADDVEQHHPVGTAVVHAGLGECHVAGTRVATVVEIGALQVGVGSKHGHAPLRLHRRVRLDRRQRLGAGGFARQAFGDLNHLLGHGSRLLASAEVTHEAGRQLRQ